ncbi:hypothetical protein AB1L30_13395 [Bremerella sp. JC817]|uniref:ImuA family protein n=1 Tax=Bremerella sp. JC817 TaxID=3231756 RepID=UPI0034574D92
MLSTPTIPDRVKIDQLNAQLREMERSRPASRETVSCGCRALDRMLPREGLLRGSLIEWLAEGAGSGAQYLALTAARQACRAGQTLVIVDSSARRGSTLYSPALSGMGLDLNRIVLVRPTDEKQALWSLEQALRCPAVGAVLGFPRQMDSYAYRRLQLAAEQSDGLGLLVRPSEVRGSPSWAELRWQVSPRPTACGWGLHVELLRCRGYLGDGKVDLTIDEQTGEIHEAYSGSLASQLAHPTLASQRA